MNDIDNNNSNYNNNKDNKKSLIMTPRGPGDVAKNSEEPIGIDESNYKEWSQKEVMIWIKVNLSNNGIDDKQIKSFLKEWKKRYITGAMLDTLKNEPEMLNLLITKCDEKEAPFGIWLVMKIIIQNLGNQDQVFQE